MADSDSIPQRKPYLFQPGQSGNPLGNALDHHSTLSVSEWVNKLLNDENFEADIIEHGVITKYKGAPIKAIIHAQIELATQHTDPAVKTKSADLLLKHGGTKKIELSGDPERPVSASLDSDTLTQFMMMAKNDTKK